MRGVPLDQSEKGYEAASNTYKTTFSDINVSCEACHGPGSRHVAEAARLAPDSVRYGYVYAIGLHSAGKRDAALARLRAADARHPYDLEILGALVSMNREAGNAKAALAYARKLAEVLPDDPAVKRLVPELEGMQR